MKILKIIAFTLAGIFVLLLVLLLSMIRPDIPVEHLKEHYADETSQFIEIDGTEVHLKDEGDGPVLLLLHGMFASLHTWDHWAENMQNEYRIIRADLPGFGLTGPHARGDYSLQASMYLLESLRNELNIDSWTLIGNSMGAGLALSYAQLYPEQTDGVVLLNGGRLLTATQQNTGETGKYEDDEEPNHESLEEDSAESQPPVDTRQSDTARPSLVLRALGSPSLRNLMSVLTPEFIINASLKEVYGDPERLDPETVTRYYELLRREGNRQAYLNRRQDRPLQYRGFPKLPEPVNINDTDVPVLILWGLLDSWIPVGTGYRLHNAIHHSELIIYDELGHVPMEEDPARTIADVREFLSRSIF
ncbi:MAG: alpha/beta hydrolase [Balneolaceae bacterium]|nr:MAG: alpha/beta hydrolase [Balneolaceae bacterium]